MWTILLLAGAISVLLFASAYSYYILAEQPDSTLISQIMRRLSGEKDRH